jgi:NDP-sugar pyrophosphorylase family protein
MTDSSGWPALILSAGLGTRLAPLSTFRAKPALPVAGTPLIRRIVAAARAAGLTHAVVNLHHRPETITGVLGDGRGLGVAIRYSWEPVVLGSAGGPARAVPLLAADRFFILNGDTLSDIGLAALADDHRRSGAEVTLAVAPADLARYNAVLSDGEGAFVGLAARGSPLDVASGLRPWHFLGVQAVNASAFAGVDPSRPSDSLREVYPRLIAARHSAVRVFPVSGVFHDIGTPADYLRTVAAIAVAEGVPFDRGERTTVAHSAKVDHSILWDRVTVGDAAALSQCIVTDDVVIPAGARYDRAVITRDGVLPL